MSRKPDFIIVGAMKCATSTLQKQLSMQPGIFMTTPKEPNFFSDDDVYARGITWYRGLYSNAAASDIVGEASTHYTKLPTYPRTIERLAAHCGGDVKFIYVIRDPVQRLVSHYMHEWSQRKVDGDIGGALERRPELVAYSLYHDQILPYLETFGRNNVLLLCYERLASHPQEQLALAASFIGYEKPAAWVESESRQNVSLERVRKFPGYEFVVGNPVLEKLRRGLVPRRIREKIKHSLTLNSRPLLDAGTLAHLRSTFDRDLRRLGALLGEDLSYDSYGRFSDKVCHEWH